MSNLTITVKRYDELKRYPELSGAAFSDAMTVGVNAIVRDTQANSPVDRGFVRSSWASEVDDDNPLRITGRVFSTAPHAPIIEGVDADGNPVEFGRRPGTRFPNITALRDWVRRHGLAFEDSAGNDLKGAVKAAAGRRAGRLGKEFQFLNKRQVSKLARKVEIESRINSIAYLIGRAIVRRGLPRQGWSVFFFHPLGRAVKANEGFIQRVFDESAERLARLIEGGR